MASPFATSKVTVEYFDPHGLFKLIAPGLEARLPLRHLHWQSHSGPLRSIDTLHVELVAAGENSSSIPQLPAVFDQKHSDYDAAIVDSFSTTAVGGLLRSTTNNVSQSTSTKLPGKERRHQIPGLRRTPYLKILVVRCDNNDAYKSQTRLEIREWAKQNTLSGSKKSSVAENHDAFEWLIVHVVLPNSPAYAQPRTSRAPDGTSLDISSRSTSRWGKITPTIFERLRADFNPGNSSGGIGSTVDHVAQIRVCPEDVPYELLPRAMSAVSAGYTETDKDAQYAWTDLIDKLKTLILASFDIRVSQYEDDIREKDVQRSLPGWNFCTFFILKEGLARGFESVGLIEDALVSYDELNVGLDTIVEEQQKKAGAAEAHGGAFLTDTKELQKVVFEVLSAIAPSSVEPQQDGVSVNLQADNVLSTDYFEDIPIASTKKPYRDLILANNVSLFDFRCYIFARQISLLLQLGKALSTREELLATLRAQDNLFLKKDYSIDSLPQKKEGFEDLSVLAEICRRTLEFIPVISQVMRDDIFHAITRMKKQVSDDRAGHARQRSGPLGSLALEVIDIVVASYSYSIAQQILAQTSTHVLPSMNFVEGHEPKVSITEPKTLMHPARYSTMYNSNRASALAKHNLAVSPSPTSTASADDMDSNLVVKNGLENLAARRGELYMLSRNVLKKAGEKKGWSDGWASRVSTGEHRVKDLKEISLDDTNNQRGNSVGNDRDEATGGVSFFSKASHGKVLGIKNPLLRGALESRDNFYQLYEVLTVEALRHFTISGHDHSVYACLADIAVLKYYLKNFSSATSYFNEATLFFGERSWSDLELSMLLMHSRCLKELDRKDEYAGCLLKLLTRAAETQRDRLEQRSILAPIDSHKNNVMDVPAIRGYVTELLEASSNMATAFCVSFNNFFHRAEVEGPAIFAKDRDSFSISIRIYSLLPDELPLDCGKLRMASQSDDGHLCEIWLDAKESPCLQPGKNKIRFHSNAIIPGIYKIDQLKLFTRNIVLIYDRSTETALKNEVNIFRDCQVVLYQRTSSFDVEVTTSKDLQLDKATSLDLEVLAGWNDILHCDLRVRSATGGLRLNTSEAKILTSDNAFSARIEGGSFKFQAIESGTSLKISLPFSVEHNVLSLCLKIEASYTTKDGTFVFAKSPSLSTSLALGVNVQDVFKHGALFSRFTVSTATNSPLRIYHGELLESDVFAAPRGKTPQNASIAFPKQPVSLLFKIVRKPNSKNIKSTKKTMYIKLHYSVLLDEVDTILGLSLNDAFQSTAALYEFAKVVVACVIRHAHSALSTSDLEKIALLGELSTSFLTSVDWRKELSGLGYDSFGAELSVRLAMFLSHWQKTNPIIRIPQSTLASQKTRRILIPVDIPSVTIVHTADIQLEAPSKMTSVKKPGKFAHDNENNTSARFEMAGTMYCVNQVLPATLHLKWTRTWDSSDVDVDNLQRNAGPISEYLEFSFEVTAPTDTWLIGGRRKGHFVIPKPNETGKIGFSSTPECEAAIPLTLIPLREGFLPYPSVEIREIVSGGSADLYSTPGAEQAISSRLPSVLPYGRLHCELDCSNLGETVRVVADRRRVTLSLDASGPGGGPLVLESERTCAVRKIVV